MTKFIYAVFILAVISLIYSFALPKYYFIDSKTRCNVFTGKVERYQDFWGWK